MRIAICDDDLHLCNSLKDNIYEYSNLHNLESVVDTFHSGEEIIKSSVKYDVIILDYQMPGINGLETARLLRNGINACACIIFLTCYPQIAISAYEVDTYRFVVKSTLYEKLFKAFDDYRKSLIDNSKLIIKTKQGAYVILTDNILFFESFDKLIYIHMNDGNIISTRSTLSKLYKLVPHTNFIQIHKSYVVNFKYILEEHNSTLILLNCSKQIPISRNYLKDFKLKYRNYLKDNL